MALTKTQKTYSSFRPIRGCMSVSPKAPPPPQLLAPPEVLAYAACSMLDTQSAVNAADLLASSDPLIRRATRSMAIADLLPEHRHLLPRAQGSASWSVPEYLLSSASTAVPISLSTLRRRINTMTVHHTTNKAEHPSVPDAAVLFTARLPNGGT